MVANPERRQLITDAALEAFGKNGSRALTHRSVDKQASLPAGTTANYFSTRSALLLAMAERIFERLTPQPERLNRIARRADGMEALVAYSQYVVERLLHAPHLALALVELRLEAARNPDIAEVVQPFLHAGLQSDIAFHESAGLPGSASEIKLLHYAINGLILDKLTAPLDPSTDAAGLTEELVHRLVRHPEYSAEVRSS